MSRFWSTTEISLLSNAVQQEQKQVGISWENVAFIVQTKSPKQCAIRYHNITKYGDTPSKKRTIWSQQQDRQIIQLAQAYKNDWYTIAREMQSCVSVVKNRYYVLQRKEKGTNYNNCNMSDLFN